MVDVRVSDHDCHDLQVMALDHFHDSRGIVARIDDNCFARVRIAHDVAIALQHSHGENFVDEFFGFGHRLQYNIGELVGQPLLAVLCGYPNAICEWRRGVSLSGVPRQFRWGDSGQPRVAVLHEPEIPFCYDGIVNFEGFHPNMSLETPLLEQHRSSGAVIGEYFGALLPSSFGNFAAEYAALRETVALVDSNYRAFFSFTGPDRQRYVNALLTSNVRDLKVGQGVVGLLLNPQGHILGEVETYMLDLAASRLASTPWYASAHFRRSRNSSSWTM